MRSILILILLCGTSLAAQPAQSDKAQQVVKAKAQPAKRPTRKQVLLMVRSSQLKAANEVAVKVLGLYGRGTFSVPYTLGSRTYLVAACQLTEEQETAIRSELGKLNGTKPTILARGKEFTGRAKAELKRRNFTPKKSIAAAKSR